MSERIRCPNSSCQHKLARNGDEAVTLCHDKVLGSSSLCGMLIVKTREHWQADPSESKYPDLPAKNLSRPAAPKEVTPVCYDEEWRTQDGRVIRVMDMSDDHVRATLNMILANRRKRKELKQAIKAIVDKDNLAWFD